ncbi:DUF1289 domain-containing protein [Geminicoccus flavidas]|uniref:DUF1289 domain-containing protein n=1 Tax=Geminicoccus flavidas TaxID=2506407 RepID=UPI0013592214|nr:DUF1289 domain-containing protein [Geminicoccus flavidas]
MSERAKPPDLTQSMPPSPCVGICQIDQATGWCGGCGRSEKELAGWRDMPAFAQRAVWADLPRRNAILGLRFRLLPLAGAALLEHLAHRSLLPGARWAIGVHGASVEFAADDGPVRAVIEAGVLHLATRGGRAALTLPAGARAFELVDGQGRATRLVLALHRARLRTPNPAGIEPIGPDRDALDPSGCDAVLVDLGLGRRALRLCVRSRDPDLLARLKAGRGTALQDVPDLVVALMQAAPGWVAISPFGRIEAEGLILRNDRAGPRTRLQLDLLASGRELEPGLELPPDYVPSASLFPDEAGLPNNASPARAPANDII